jgi:hypothetical protein
MDMLDQPSWHWSLLLIALTLAFHATAVVMLGIVAVRIRLRLETRGLWKLVPIMICTVAVLGLLLAVVHGIECGIWAVAYLRLGALDSPRDALLFSIDSMSTRGASGLTLQSHWQLMGALEAINGMLLFGVSTAWLFTVAQGYWFMIAAHVAPNAQHP